MVNLVTGDLFDSEAQTLVNAVNCAGVMGKGIALAFKRRYPAMFADYAARCKDGSVRLGEPYLYRGESLPWVLNFPTKNHWRFAAKLEDIVAGLAYLEEHYRAWSITSLAVPALGCGAGQLAWDVVGPVLSDAFSRFDIPVALYPRAGKAYSAKAAATVGW
jgi:O-acetyl-ADP-ribose deacetylase (regulator of RNase III)